MIGKIFLCVLLTTIFFDLNGQNYVFSQQNAPVISISGQVLRNAWHGGLDLPQFNTIDLNQDGVEDLAVFEKSLSKVLTYLAVNGQYIYAPQYESFFPKLELWMALADYNCDGKKDLYTHTFGNQIKIYKNITSANEPPKWKIVADAPMSVGADMLMQFMQVGPSNYPSIIDIDNDGDLDLLTYGTSFGSIEFHKNNSIEKYGVCDSITFEKYTSCWGKFTIGSDCNNLLSLNSGCINSGATHDNNRLQHNGSSITIADLNGDGKKDLILGDVSCPGIFVLTNVGNNLLATISGYTPGNYPTSKPINLFDLPATFYVDIDFDGKKDLLASPLIAGPDALADLSQSAWLYKNTGSDSVPGFDFIKPDFLQSDGVDVGQYAYPALADYDADGDLDLFVGNKGKMLNDTLRSTIHLFENTGTKDSAFFVLKTTDYLGLSNYNYNNIKPNFADVDYDGDVDLYITRKFQGIAQMSYIPNQNPTSSGFNFSATDRKDFNTAPIILSAYDNSLLYDVNKDGLLDLLLARTGGRLQYYRNTGNTSTPGFSLALDTLGGIKNNFEKDGLSCFVTQLNSKDTTELITIDRTGIINIYPRFQNHLSKFKTQDKNILLNQLDGFTYPTNLGKGGIITAGDLNNDKKTDIIIGTQSGGLYYLKNMREVVTVIVPVPKDTTTIPGPNSISNGPNETKLSILPNPASDKLYIHSNKIITSATILTMDGRLVTHLTAPGHQYQMQVETSSLSNGYYFLKINIDEAICFKRIIILK